MTDMSRYLCYLAVLLCLIVQSAASADMLQPNDFPESHQTALTFDLSKDKKITAEIAALSSASASLSFLRVPFEVKNPEFGGRHLVFQGSDGGDTLFAFNMRPSQTRSLTLASFDPVVEQQPLSVLIAATGRDLNKNLYIMCRKGCVACSCCAYRTK